MNDDPIAVMLKFGFLAVLYLFLLWVARSSLRDLTGHEDAGVAVGTADTSRGGRRESRRAAAGADLRAGVSPRLEVVLSLIHI